MPPMVVSGSQLSELLCLLGAFHPCTLITAAGDGLDERRPADMGDRQPSCRDRRASALRVHDVRAHFESMRLFASR